MSNAGKRSKLNRLQSQRRGGTGQSRSNAQLPPKARDKWLEYAEQAKAYYRQTGKHPNSSPKLRRQVNDVLHEIRLAGLPPEQAEAERRELQEADKRIAQGEEKDQRDRS